MGAGASASEQSQLLAEARAGGATQEEIDAYIAENNLNTAQRPAQTQPSHLCMCMHMHTQVRKERDLASISTASKVRA